MDRTIQRILDKEIRCLGEFLEKNKANKKS